MDDFAKVGAFFSALGIVILCVVIFSYETKWESRESIVKNTDACFYLDENHKRQFSWSCDE